MASYRIQSVEKFNFGKPEEWPRWIKRFERFRQVSGLDAKTEATQVSTLVYSMGEKAEDILASFSLSADELKVYDTVKSKFESYFVKKRNPIFERARFNRRKQEDNESVDDFVTDLYRLAANCEYGNLHDELIRDRIVVGIKDSDLSTKLQMEATLTLEQAVTRARQSEAVKSQQDVVRGEDIVDGVQAGRRRRQPRQPKPYKENPNPPNKHTTCFRCGSTPMHSRQNCPAKEAICHKCGKRGHFKRCCKTKQIREVQNQEQKSDSDQEGEFMGSVTADTVELNHPWTVPIELNGHQTIFKIDTGADVTVIPESLYNEDRDGKLQTTQVPLSGPSGHNLQVRGKFNGKLYLPSNQRETKQDLYVISGLKRALLGRPAIEALHVVARIELVSESEILKQFPGLFKGLGKMEGHYEIKLKENATPFALTTPRRVAIPLLPKVKAELQRMEKMGVITKIEEPTDWCAGIVVVPKQNGKVRICVDLTKLNESVRRERCILPSVEQTLAQIGTAKYFSKLDANSGYWQVELHPESRKLTTFITPFGRFYFNRLPFGITSAPEHFQRRMTELLGDIEGVVCLVDDVLVTGKTEEEHDTRLIEVLSRLSKANLTLGLDKCKFRQPSVKFLGQMVNQTGVMSDPDKVRAIVGMKPPTNVSELRRFLGLVNQQSKFSPHLADQTQPLRELLSSKNMWNWGHAQEQAFQNLKKSLSSSEVLAPYQVDYETVVSADASSYGLGAVLRQRQPDGSLRPIAYASRALTETERRYAQIEKEALAATWASEKFQQYLLGKSFKIETDHKPLVPLLSSKMLSEVPLRIQRFRLRMMRFSFTISHVPGAELHTADALSRAPVGATNGSDDAFYQEVQMYVNSAVKSLPASEEKIVLIKEKQELDPECKQLKKFCEGEEILWKGTLKRYKHSKSEFSVVDGLLLKGERVVIPVSLRAEMLERIHAGHQGTTKCRQRAKESMWWPGIKQDIESTVAKCEICCRHQVQRPEPLMPLEMPVRPWQRVGTDLFEWKKQQYLLVVDYYSRFIEVARLTSTTSSYVITHLKSIFSRHGIPEVVISDNGPQYSAELFSQFSKEFGFKHMTSSPKHPQVNGAAERAVKTVKQLLSKNKDQYLAMLIYRSTPLENGYSPAELLMGRKLRTNLPVLPNMLKPKVPEPENVLQKETELRVRMKRNFDDHHKARSLPPLSPGDRVYIPESQSEGVVMEPADPRSYWVDTEDSRLRRNRRDIILMPSGGQSESRDGSSEQNSEQVQQSHSNLTQSGTVTRSGRHVNPPERLMTIEA